MYNHKHTWKNCPEYRAWLQMNRSHGPEVVTAWKWMKRDHRYNWKAFNFFLANVGRRPEKHVLIRLDKSGMYGPGNVRWGTHAENARHRGPFRKFSYSRDEELIEELERRGYVVTGYVLCKQP